MPVVAVTDMSNSAKTALCGVITALSVICMTITVVVPVTSYSCAMIAGVLLVIIVIEVNAVWAFYVYVAVSLTLVLVLPDKEAAFCYIVLFGIYPILKQFIEKLRSVTLRWILKLIVFDISVAALFYILVFILNIPKESFSIAGLYVPWLFVIAGDFAFILYDIALTGVVTSYVVKWRKYIFKGKW